MASKSGYEQYLEEQMRDPEYAAAAEAAAREIEAIDQLIRALDARRIAIGISKAELARRAQTNPEMVRRLFSAHGNPTLATVLKITAALGCQLQMVPDAGPGAS